MNIPLLRCISITFAIAGAALVACPALSAHYSLSLLEGVIPYRPLSQNTIEKHAFFQRVVAQDVDAVEKMISFIKKRMGTIDVTTKVGKTPLMYAAELGYGKIVELLVSHGADILREDGTKTIIYNTEIKCFNALSWAAVGGEVSVIKYLINTLKKNKMLSIQHLENALLIAKSHNHLAAQEFIKKKIAIIRNRNEAVMESLNVSAESNKSVAECLKTMMQLDAGVCTWCRKSPPQGVIFKKCGRCLAFYYCSDDCQRNDWHTNHKKICKKPANSVAPNSLAAGAPAASSSNSSNLTPIPVQKQMPAIDNKSPGKK